MGNEDSGSSLYQLIVFFVHFALRDGVKGSGGLIQDNHRRALVERPGQHEFLHFPAGKRHPFFVQLFVHDCFRTPGKFFHQPGKSCFFQALPQFIRILLSLFSAGNIFHQGKRKCKHLLEYHRIFPENLPPGHCPHVFSVQIDRP